MLNELEAVLVMVDFQGKLAQIVDRSELVVPNALRLVKGCQALDVPILATAQVPDKLGPIIDALEEPLNGVDIIAKSHFSAFREPDFMLALDQTKRRQVILTGIEAHVCVLQSALDLMQEGFQAHVVVDAISSRKAIDKEIALQRMAAQGVTLTTTESVLFELVKVAGSSEFKQISKLVK